MDVLLSTYPKQRINTHFILYQLMGNKKSSNKSDVLNASEIGQYQFCSMAWYLQRQGYEPISPLLDVGTEKHMLLGKAVDQVQSDTRWSKVLLTIGCLLMIMVFLIFLLEVIL